MTGKVLIGKPLQGKVEEKAIGEFLFEQAAKYGDRICQINTSTGEKESFQSVNLRSVKTALEMQKRGITSKDVVMCCSFNTLDITIPIIAALYLGAKTASLDPTLALRDVRHLLSLVSPKMIFVEEGSLALVETGLERIDHVKPEIIVIGNSEKYCTFQEFQRPKSEELTFKPAKVDLSDTAVILFSSGSTGLPKAICLSHKGILFNLAVSNELGFNYSGILHFTTFYWISAIFCLFFGFMAGGYRLVMANFEPNKCFQVIEKYKVTYILSAPILSYALVNYPNALKYDTSSLHCLLLGGTPISTSHLKRLQKLLKHTRVITGYGMSESCFISTYNLKNEAFLTDDKLGSCGEIVPGITLKVVDPDTENILGPNQSGEIRVKTPGIMNGYFNADSSKEFDEDNFLKTGDTGYFDDDGFIYVAGRIKEMFKYKSWHIVPASLEAVLLEHPDVKEAAVFGIPNDEFGDVPTASVVLFKHSKATSKEIQQFVSDRVPDRENLRGGVAIVEELERTTTGKLMRSQIRESFMHSFRP